MHGRAFKAKQINSWYTVSMSSTPPITTLGNVTTYQAGMLQAKAFRKIKKHFEICLKDYGLTSIQWFMLGTIYDSGKQGIAMTELAAQLGIALPTLLTAVALLESKGMVTKTKHSGDSRVKMIAVTPSFAEECPRIEASLRQKLRSSLYKNISSRELTTYMRVLDTFIYLDS
jgi:DNA-binding MarR family transcriptional regulator